MRFGKSYDEFKTESGGDAGDSYIRALKEGDTVGVLLTGPEEWVGYYEHYNPRPNGFSYPCTQEESCPGCNSDNERERSRGNKVAFPMLVDNKWVNVYKIPKEFAERLAKRANKSIDREYEITRVGKDKNTTYDVETGEPVKLDRDKHMVPDIEQILNDMYEQTWGDPEVVDVAPKAEEQDSKSSSKKTQEAEYEEAELRAKSPRELRKILRSENLYDLAPEDVQEADEADVIVDWMLKAVS